MSTTSERRAELIGGLVRGYADAVDALAASDDLEARDLAAQAFRAAAVADALDEALSTRWPRRMILRRVIWPRRRSALQRSRTRWTRRCRRVLRSERWLVRRRLWARVGAWPAACGIVRWGGIVGAATSMAWWGWRGMRVAWAVGLMGAGCPRRGWPRWTTTGTFVLADAGKTGSGTRWRLRRLSTGSFIMGGRRRWTRGGRCWASG